MLNLRRRIRIRTRLKLLAAALGGTSKGAQYGVNATYADDGFATTHYSEFLMNDPLNHAFDTSLSSVPRQELFRSIRWRAHIATWAANQGASVEGDFIECGVWWGILSKTICEYMSPDAFQTRRFYLVDTWGEMEGSHHDPDYSADIYEDVRERFSQYPGVMLVRGVVPQILSSIPTGKVAYLSIDMNGSEAELAALKFYWPKLSVGAVVYLDDYGWNYPELRSVIDLFLIDKPEQLLIFPSGNAVIIKQ
jgi:O-methyltransferase